MANITVISLDDTGYDTVAVLNANFAALNAALGLANRHAQDLTNAIGQVTVVHNLGTRDVVVQIWNTAGVAEQAEVSIVDANSSSITFNTLFSGRVVVL
jgi:hypothetical protein